MYSNELICNILEYINTHLTYINIEEISCIFGYEKSYIMKKFKKELNITIINYVNIIKIINSLKDLNRDNSLLKVALESGFNSEEYYSEIFKKYLGVSPKTYRDLLYRRYLISDEEANTIQNKLSILYEIKEKAIKYLNHKKPSCLSIMKLEIVKKKEF